MMDRVTEGWNLQQEIKHQNQQRPNNTHGMLEAIRKQVIQCRNVRKFFTLGEQARWTFCQAERC